MIDIKRLEFYSEEEIREMINKKERYVYVDNGLRDLVIRRQDIPDFIVYLNREIGLYSSVLKDSNNIRLLDMALKSGHITLIEYLLQVNYFMDAHKYLLEIMRQKAIGMSELSQWS